VHVSDCPGHAIFFFQWRLTAAGRHEQVGESDNLESIVESAENLASAPASAADGDGIEQAESTIVTESEVLIETVDGVIKQRYGLHDPNLRSWLRPAINGVMQFILRVFSWLYGRCLV
jgi:hypothetical protein